eukprot:1195651-Prorocentrum_minimum.AAC.5
MNSRVIRWLNRVLIRWVGSDGVAGISELGGGRGRFEYMKSDRFMSDRDFSGDQMITDSIRIDMELFLKELNEQYEVEYMI